MKSLLAYAAASALLLLTTASAEPPPATTGPVDGLVSSPANFKLLLENEHVRVLQYTLPPHALDHWQNVCHANRIFQRAFRSSLNHRPVRHWIRERDA